MRAAADHAELVEKVLRAATKVSISIEVVHPTRAQYLVERTVPDPPVVRDAAGTVLAQSPLDLLGAIEIFNQHELAELPDDKAYVAQMLGRFGGIDPEVDRRAEVLDALRDNRESQLKRSGQIGNLDDELAALPKLHEQLAQFEAQGVDEGLRTQEQLQREERLYSTAAARLEGIRSALETVEADSQLDISFAGAEATNGLPNAANVNQIAPILETLATAFATGLDSLRAAVVTAAQQLEKSKQTWSNQTKTVREQYQTIVRALQDAGLDAAKYLLLGGRIEALEASASTRLTLVGQLSKLRTERLQLLAEHGDLEQNARQRLGEAATEANAHVKGLVFVKPVRSSDRGAIEALITQNVAGQRTQIMTALRHENFSPRAFVAACRVGAAALEARYSIKGAQAQALLSAGESLWLKIEEHRIGLAAEAQLNVGTDTNPVYKNLSNLSKGQKATALLLLLLTDTTSPLIIDQPEDNLDNQFVYKGIVPRLRDLKGTRQVILSTHNANLPVLGDAELVIALNATDGHGVVARGGIGSIDDASVRGLAGDLLEGGREAFDARRHLYGY